MIKKFLILLIALLPTFLGAAPDDNLEPYGAAPKEEFTNRSFFDNFNNRYVFEYSGSNRITYSIYPNRWQVKAGYINIEVNIDDMICTPVAFGGLRFRDSLGNDSDPVGVYKEPVEYRENATTEITNISFKNDVLTLDYRDIYQGYEHTWRIEYSIKGKSLIFHIYATDGSINALGNYCGIFFDRSLGTLNPRWQILPYVVESDVVFADKYFYAVYVDRGKSSASDIQVKTKDYSNDSIYSGAHTINWINQGNVVVPLDEVCYLTVSSHVLDVLPSINHKPSSTRDMLDNRIVIDAHSYGTAYGEYGNNFVRLKNILLKFSDYGFKEVMTIIHIWQNHGYDRGLPDHYPPGSLYGDEDSFKELVAFSNDKGWLFAAHENYVMMDINYPELDLEDLSRDRNGNPYELYWNSYAIASNKMAKYAEPESTELKKNCNTTAAYLDLNAGNNPMTLKQIDLSPVDKNSNSFKLCIEDTKNFLQLMRNIYQGPIIGEGGIGWGRYDTFYAGYVDGVDRLPERETNVFVVPEHELRVIKPLQANHGMGRYKRFFVGPDYPLYNRNFNLYDLDLYRTLEIAFGHGGYIHVDDYVGRIYLIYLAFCREYYMMQQLQSRYMPRDIVPKDILYYDEGDWISQDELIKRNRSLEDVLLKIAYSNGLNIWINQKDSEYIWEPDIYNGITLPIPQNGFVALRTEGELFLECSIEMNEERIDYVYCDEYIFGENRDHVLSDIGYIKTDGLAVLQKNSFGNYDVHLLEGTHISDNLREKKIIDTSYQCHINIIYESPDEFVLTAPYVFNPADLTVTYYDLPQSWYGENGKLPEDISNHIKIYEIQNEKEIPVDDVTVTTSTGSELIFDNIVVDIRYLVRYEKE